MFDFDFVYILLLISSGEIDKRDERKSNGVAHWEPH